MTDAQSTTALAVTGVTRPTLQAASQIESAWQLAQYAAKSSFSKIANPYDAFFVIQFGWELGILPMTALRLINSIDGKPAASAELQLALIHRSGKLQLLEIQGDARRASTTMKRSDTGLTHTATLTIEAANTAGLTGKGNWKKYPERILKWRTISECAQILFPDVIAGIDFIDPGTYGEEVTEPELAETFDAQPPAPAQHPQPIQFPEPTQQREPLPRARHRDHWTDDPANVTKLAEWAISKGYTLAKAKADALVELYQLLGVQDFTGYASGKLAWAAIEEALQTPAERKAPAATSAEVEDGVIVTWGNADNEALARWLDDNFGLSVADVFDQVDQDEFDHDLTVHGSAQSAITRLTEIARRQHWPLVSTQLTYKIYGSDPTKSFVEFATIFGGIRMYSRTVLANAVSPAMAAKYNLAQLGEGEVVQLEKPDRLIVSWEARPHYSMAIAVREVDDIPFDDIPL